MGWVGGVHPGARPIFRSVKQVLLEHHKSKWPKAISPPNRIRSVKASTSSAWLEGVSSQAAAIFHSIKLHFELDLHPDITNTVVWEHLRHSA